MNKHIIILILLAIFTFTLIACGNSEDNKNTTTDTTAVDTKTTDTTADTKTTDATADSKTISNDVFKEAETISGPLSNIAKDEEVVIAFAKALVEFENQNKTSKAPINVSSIREIEGQYETELKRVADFCLDENNELSKSEECQIIVKYRTLFPNN